jgi:hypothetical protein
MQQVVGGGRVGINLNGDPENYFRTYKGLMQGDPLLFNLVTDALATILTKAREVGMTKGLIPELIEGALTHLQYADDIAIFLECDEESIANTKFLLYCFEGMSGLKINFHKSEILVVGASKEESDRIANCFNYKEGVFPFKYLGIHVSSNKLFTADLIYVELKVEKRLPAWQGLLLSSRGKSILIESSLSSLPKEFGGLGFTDTRLMNKCLLSKWIFKIERGDMDLCSTLLRKKYLGGRVFQWEC